MVSAAIMVDVIVAVLLRGDLAAGPRHADLGGNAVLLQILFEGRNTGHADDQQLLNVVCVVDAVPRTLRAIRGRNLSMPPQL